MPNHNSQQRSSPDALICHQQAGTEQGGAGCIASGKDQAWMPWGQSEGANMRQQPKLWDSQREKKKERERTFPWKALTQGTARPTHRTKDWVNTWGELAGCGPAHPPPEAERQAGDIQSWKGAIWAPKVASSTKLRAGSQLLTKCSWDPGRLTSNRRVTARDQLPRGDTQHTWDGAPTMLPGNQAAGTWEAIWRTAHLGSVLTKHLVTWAAWTWEGHKTQAQPSMCLCGVPENLNLSSLDLGSACNPGPALDSSPAEQPGAWAV